MTKFRILGFFYRQLWELERIVNGYIYICVYVYVQLIWKDGSRMRTAGVKWKVESIVEVEL